MTKPTTLFLISCVVLLLGISTALTQGDDLKYCPKQDTFLGGPCGGNGSTQCLLDFLGKYGASSMPKNCRCKSLGSDKRLCACEIVCQKV